MSWLDNWKKGLTGSPGPDWVTEEEEAREMYRRLAEKQQAHIEALKQQQLEMYKRMHELANQQAAGRVQSVTTDRVQIDVEGPQPAAAEPTVSMRQAQAIMDILIDMAKEEDAAERSWLVAKAAGLLLGLAGERDRQLQRDMPNLIYPDGLQGIVDDGAYKPGHIYRSETRAEKLARVGRAARLEAAQNVGSPAEGGELPMPKMKWKRTDPLGRW